MRATTPSSAAATAAAPCFASASASGPASFAFHTVPMAAPWSGGERPAGEPGHVAAAGEECRGAERLDDGCGGGGRGGCPWCASFAHQVPGPPARRTAASKRPSPWRISW